MPALASVVMVPAAMPPMVLRAMALLMPMKPEEVPMTMGSRPPMGPMGYSWMKVTRPAITMAFCSSVTRRALNPASTVRPQVPRMIKSGDRFPTNMARTCCRPRGMAWPSGIRPSSS